MKTTPAEFASIFESAQEGKRETPITLRHHMKMVADRDGFEVDIEAAARVYEATVGVHMPDLNAGWGEDAARRIGIMASIRLADELRQILILLWEEGLHDSEAAKRIDAMIPILRGEKGE